MNIIHGPKLEMYEVAEILTVTEMNQLGFFKDAFERFKNSVGGGENGFYTYSLNEAKQKAIKDLETIVNEKKLAAVTDIKIDAQVIDIKNDIIVHVEITALGLKAK